MLIFSPRIGARRFSFSICCRSSNIFLARSYDMAPNLVNSELGPHLSDALVPSPQNRRPSSKERCSLRELKTRPECKIIRELLGAISCSEASSSKHCCSSSRFQGQVQRNTEPAAFDSNLWNSRWRDSGGCGTVVVPLWTVFSRVAVISYSINESITASCACHTRSEGVKSEQTYDKECTVKEESECLQ